MRKWPEKVGKWPFLSKKVATKNMKMLAKTCGKILKNRVKTGFLSGF